MTLTSMWANGVRSPLVSCELRHHKAVFNVDALDDAIPGSCLRAAHRLHQLGSSVHAPGRTGWSEHRKRA
jgi:hypothetical protein